MPLRRGWWVGLLNTGCRVRGLDPKRWVLVDPGLGSSVGRRHDRNWLAVALVGCNPETTRALGIPADPRPRRYRAVPVADGRPTHSPIWGRIQRETGTELSE